MPFADQFPATLWVRRRFTSPFARRIYRAIVILLFAATTAARVRAYVLTRRIHAVLNSLERLRIDQSTEDQLLRTVPYLVREQRDRTEGPSTVRGYYVVISNESNLDFLNRFAFDGPGDWLPRGWLLTAADRLGFHYLRFNAAVILLDGKVSSIRYGIAKDLIFPRALSEIVAVQSVHGFWSSYRRPIEVTSSDDESPQYRVEGGNEPISIGPNGSKAFLHITYSYDAPTDLTSRAFKVELSCFWSLLGCRSAGQIAPLAWQDKLTIDAATTARLKSAEPCPDRILAGRVRYLLDLDLLLLEVMNTRTERINEEGQVLDEHYSDYRVVENLRGNSQGTWNSVRFRQWIPSPTDPDHMIFNPARNMPLRPGDRELMFTNFDFDSCAVVPATPSALSVVRGALPTPKRAEDEVLPHMLL
jgi:hypothetical protein